MVYAFAFIHNCRMNVQFSVSCFQTDCGFYVPFWCRIIKAGEELVKPEVADYFAKAIMKCVPKSYAQASGEVSGNVFVILLCHTAS